MAVHPNPLLCLIPEAVPAELRATARWVCWKARPKPSGKLDKLPCSPHTGAVGDAHDSATWGSFEQAVTGLPLVFRRNATLGQITSGRLPV